MRQGGRQCRSFLLRLTEHAPSVDCPLLDLFSASLTFIIITIAIIIIANPTGHSLFKLHHYAVYDYPVAGPSVISRKIAHHALCQVTQPQAGTLTS